MALSPLISRHLLPALLKMLYATLRISLTPLSGERKDYKEGCIVAFWHGKMVVGWLFARALFAGQPAAAVVSLSKDGSILSDALGRLGFSLLRGSSSKGSYEVVRSIEESLRKGWMVAVTPDGPRGPVHQFKYGMLRLASASNAPLIFAEITSENSWKLKSWDQFEIPKPFSKVAIRLHLIATPEFHSEEELHAYTQQLSDRFSHA